MDAVEGLDVDRDHFDKFHTRDVIARLLEELWKVPEVEAEAQVDCVVLAWQVPVARQKAQNWFERQASQVVSVGHSAITTMEVPTCSVQVLPLSTE